MAAAAQEPEAVLAQRLAANEKSTRTKALKTFRKYLSLRSQRTEGGFTSDDLMKIWKGLFYCLWMQDKPLLQEELSEKISGLIHSFHTTDSQLLYFETFLQTVKREWNGIDRLRMDKFFQLVRFMFRQVFEVLKRREWDSGMVNGFAEVFTAQLLQSPAHVPDGLLLHVLELYMTELGRVGSAELTAEQNLTFIDPFCKTMAKAKDRKLLAAISKKIFSTIVEHASYAVEDLMKELGDSGEDSDSGQASDNDEESVEEDQLNSKAFKKAKRTKVNGIQRGEESDEGSEEDLLEMDHVDSEEKLSDDETESVLQFDYGAIAGRLFEWGGRSNTPNFNRGKMYRLVKIFRDLSEGVFPHDDEAAVNKKNKTNKKKKRKEPWADEEEYPAKKYKAACEKKQNPSEPDQDDTPSDATRNHNKKKQKKKGKMKREDVKKQTTELNKTEEDAEKSTETSQATVETPVGSGGDAIMQQGEETHKNNEPGSESKVEVSAKTKKSKSKKLKSKLQEDEVEVAVEHELISEDADGEVESGTPETKALPSSRKKCGKKCKKNKSEESSSNKRTHETLINVPHIEDISASTPAKRKKKKQKSATVVEEIATAEAGTDVKTLEDCSDKPEEASTMRKKKNKKQKGKEMPVEIDNRVEIEVKESDVASDEPPAEISELKLSKKTKKKKMKLVPSEEKEPEVALEAACTSLLPCTLESSSTPVQLKKKKKAQKNQKMLLGDQRVDESLSAEATDETVPKKKSKKKQAAEAETPETDCSLLTPLKKGKKKRKTQTEDVETSQINGHTGTEDPEISISLTPSKKKKKMKKASSKSDFVSFHGHSKTPSPLFCKVKPKGSPGTPLSGIKTFQTPKSEAKKVRFGLKNNKMTEFRKTDQSLLVSPVGESRVAFDPKKKPTSGVLKSPSSSPSVLVKSPAIKRRPTAADFF